MIKLVIFDIDGVITDGSIIVDTIGKEQKKINLKDIDAIFQIKREGYRLAAITGEDSDIVNYFERRFPWDYFYKGNKSKPDAIREILQKENLTNEEICYIGDGKYDVEPLAYAGLGICPRDAIDKAKQAADMILQQNGGCGCLWELLDILKTYNDGAVPEHYFYQRLAGHTDIFKKMGSDMELIKNVMGLAEDIYEALLNGGRLFLCGNGGSAADAQHIATEFISRFFHERPALNAEALTVNTSTLTAVGNDYGYERIFVRQLEAKAKKGDVLIGISTSGKSKNVTEALKYAKENGIRTALWMGSFDSAQVGGFCDYVIKVPSEVTPRIQEAHMFIGHTLAEYIEQKIVSEDKQNDKGI